MINVDLSKLLHPRFWDMVPAFMPGLFFEVCVLCARPELVYGIAARAHLDRYALVVVALIVAFVVGTAFMLWVRLIRLALAFVDRSGRWGWGKLLGYLLRRGSPSKLSKFASSRFVNEAFREMMSPRGLGGVQRARHRAAAGLLRRRYGLEPPDWQNSSEWQGWNSVLGIPRLETFKGVLLVMAAQATGWSALAAAYVAPALRNRPYFVFSLFLVVYGILAEWNLVRWWNHPASRSLVMLRTTLDEIPKEPISDEKKDGEAEVE